MEGLTDQQQDISVQELFLHPSSVQRPQTIWSGSQMQSYPRTTHGPKKTQMQEEIHSELTEHNAFRVLWASSSPGFVWPEQELQLPQVKASPNPLLEHRCCDSEFHRHSPQLGRVRQGEAQQPAQSFQEGAERVAAFPKDSCTAYMVPLSNVAVKSHMALPDLPTSTHRVFWAWWRLSWTYQAA